MFIVHVFIHVKPDCIEGFLTATEDNASHSRQEPGVKRFDVMRQLDDPNRFVLVEVYNGPDDMERHKETAHYARWRAAADDMMAETRYSVKCSNISPADGAW